MREHPLVDLTMFVIWPSYPLEKDIVWTRFERNTLFYGTRERIEQFFFRVRELRI
jgi:hypothetical protein